MTALMPSKFFELRWRRTARCARSLASHLPRQLHFGGDATERVRYDLLLACNLLCPFNQSVSVGSARGIDKESFKAVNLDKR